MTLIPLVVDEMNDATKEELVQAVGEILHKVPLKVQEELLGRLVELRKSRGVSGG